MRVLRAGLGFIHVRGLGAVFGAEFLLNQRARRGLRLLGDAQRVGTHIGDQAVRGAFAEADALIELLRDHHRALRREAEPAVGLLLQGGGGERRHRLAALDGVLDAADRERRVFQLSDNPGGLLAVGDGELLLGRAVELGGEGLAGRLEQLSGDGPVFLGNERLDFLLALDDHPRGDRLHAACGEAAFDFFPEEGADFIADEAVENAAGLLRIDQIHIQIARVPDGLLHGVFGQLVEGDALRLFRIQPEYGGEMPAYGLALAVGVGRQKDLGGVLGFLFQGVDQLALPADVDVFRLKIMLDVDAELAFGQIPDMSLGGNHLVALSEKALDGGHLRGRLHDNECCRAHRNASYLSVRRVAGFVHTL